MSRTTNTNNYSFNQLPAEARKHFEAAANRAVESENPEAVLEELETSYLCDGLDNMVRAGGVAAAAIVASPSGMKASLTDEGFDADTYALCKTLVIMHEKKQEKMREEARRRELESTQNEHGAVVATFTGLVDSMLPNVGAVDGDPDPELEGGGMVIPQQHSTSFGSTVGENNNNDEHGGGGNHHQNNNNEQSTKSKTIPLVPPLGPWETEQEKKQAWIRRMQHILDVPQSSVLGKAYFVFVSLVVIMSSVTSVVETMPVVNPIVRPQYFSLWNGLEWFATTIFTIDFLARLAVYTYDESLPTSYFQNFLTFWKSPVNIIDFITLLPQYIQPAFTGRIVTGNLRTLRLLRLYKVVRRFQGFHRLSLALTRSFSALVGPLAFLAACVFFLSAVLFAAERGDYDPTQDAFLVPDPLCDNQPVSFLEGPVPPGSPCPNSVVSLFISQWQAFWWSVVTMCTVGYGDFVPTSWVGRLVATVTIIVGMVFFSMPIAVVGTNYTIAVQMTSKSEEADKEDALQREDQRDHELIGGATHPGRRLLKLLGELLAPSDGSGPAQLNLCAPSLNDLYVIEGVLECVVSSMIAGKPEAALPLWVAKWPGGVKETLRSREAVYRSAVISRPLILHLGSEGKSADTHYIQQATNIYSNSNKKNSSAQFPGGQNNDRDDAAAAAIASRKAQQESAANAVVGTSVTFPQEGNTVPRVVIYTPEIRSAIENYQVAEVRRKQREEQGGDESDDEEDDDGSAFSTTSSNTNSVQMMSGYNNAISQGAHSQMMSRRAAAQAARQKRQQQQDIALREAINPPTVLPHHGTMTCMRVWGEPTFLIFSKTSSKEGILRTTASNNKNVPPLDYSLLQESVQNNLRRLFADGMVQSLRSFQQAQQDQNSITAAVTSTSSSSSSSPNSGSNSNNNSSNNATSQQAALISALTDPTKQDFSIEQLVFRHAVLKQQQWLALELKPVRVKHGDRISFGAAHSDLIVGRESYLNYQFEDNSNGNF